MPPQDKEARFERVLARHLRRGEAIANCPDAETLAAYHERALTAEEMSAFKGHIAACGRCQEVLAGLEASEEVTAREEDELYVASSAPARAAESMRAAAAMPAARVARGRPKRIWKWMAPAAAVAAGILVWVSVKETRRAPVETTTVAVNKQPTDAGRTSPELKAQAPAQSADERAGIAEKRAQPGLPAATPPASRGATRKEADELAAQLNGTNQKLDQKLRRQDEKAREQQHGYPGSAENQFSTLKKQPAVPPQANQKAALPSTQVGIESGKKEAGQVARENASANSYEYQDRREQLAAAEKAKRAMQEEQQKQAQADKDAAGFTAAATAETKPVGTLNERKSEKLHRLSKPPAEPQATSALRDRGLLFATSSAGLIFTPEKGVMWRVGPAGMILRTVDGGLSWMQQVSGVSVELLTGSAPAETICWVVGRGGTILRTTDGKHWQAIASPTKSDLIGIDARDAQTAAVWTSEKLPKYVTRDGGKTWQRAGAE